MPFGGARRPTSFLSFYLFIFFFGGGCTRRGAAINKPGARTLPHARVIDSHQLPRTKASTKTGVQDGKAFSAARRSQREETSIQTLGTLMVDCLRRHQSRALLYLADCSRLLFRCALRSIPLRRGRNEMCARIVVRCRLSGLMASGTSGGATIVSFIADSRPPEIRS